MYDRCRMTYALPEKKRSNELVDVILPSIRAQTFWRVNANGCMNC